MKFPVAQFPKEDVVAAIHPFPNGSAGGPDGIWSHHLSDLMSNKETGLTLVTALTALMNLLMAGKCPSSVTSVLFGGWLIALQKESGAFGL